MAERRAPGKLALTVAAIASTVAGWLAMTVDEAPAESASTSSMTSLPPLPTAVAARPLPRAARRPAPVAITRSSR